MKYLPLYYKWIRAGKLPDSGLCHSLWLDDNDLFHLFKPKCPDGYWAYWEEYFDHPVYTQDVDNDLKYKLCYEFNPLRQNIILLLAAINNEL